MSTKNVISKNGVWKTAPLNDSPSSGGGRFVVTFSYDEGTETWSTDKTIAECVAAWEAGQTLFAYNDGNYMPMSYYNSADTYMEFVAVDGETGTTSGFGIDAEGVYRYDH